MIIIIGAQESTQINRLSCQILIKIQFSWLSFQKSSNIKFHEYLSIGTELFHAESRRTDRYDEANSRLLKFCERA